MAVYKCYVYCHLKCSVTATVVVLQPLSIVHAALSGDCKMIYKLLVSLFYVDFRFYSVKMSLLNNMSGLLDYFLLALFLIEQVYPIQIFFR